jgi:hypothetical protein
MIAKLAGAVGQDVEKRLAWIVIQERFWYNTFSFNENEKWILLVGWWAQLLDEYLDRSLRGHQVITFLIYTIPKDIYDKYFW